VDDVFKNPFPLLERAPQRAERAAAQIGFCGHGHEQVITPQVTFGCGSYEGDIPDHIDSTAGQLLG
jgi:hypothetical protein